MVLTLCPLTIPFDRLVNGKGFLPQLEWSPQEDSRIVVWDLRQGSKGLIGSWRADPFWVSAATSSMCGRMGRKGGGVGLEKARLSTMARPC